MRKDDYFNSRELPTDVPLDLEGFALGVLYSAIDIGPYGHVCGADILNKAESCGLITREYDALHVTRHPTKHLTKLISGFGSLQRRVEKDESR